MRIAVTGVTGRVGAALSRHLRQQHEVIDLPRADFDLTEPARCIERLETLDLDVLINPAAISSPDLCEDDPRLAMKVNSGAPGRLALWAAERGVRMIHFSTDYVFDGESTIAPDEAVPAKPLGAYGRGKRAGELAVLAHPGHLVLRVSWVFGPEKPSFIDQVMAKARNGEPLEAIADKTSLPTYTQDLAEWTSKLIKARASGLLHACNSGPPVSWHGLAEHVVETMHGCGALAEIPKVSPLALADMPGFRAPRPRFSAMDSSQLAVTLGGPLRPWHEAVAAYVTGCCGAGTAPAP